MADNEVLTPQTITMLKQVTPDQISQLAEQVLEAEKIIVQSTEELDHLSACLGDLASKKSAYDDIAGKVRKRMRNLIPKI